jgi:hypothetical protein
MPPMKARYLQRTTLCSASGIASLIFFSSVFPASEGSAAQGEFQVKVEPDRTAEVYEALSHRDAEWYGSTFWTGPDWTRVGRNWHHPGNETPSVRSFVAPRDGRVTISGRVFKADTNGGGGDGIQACIRHGGQELWRMEIDGDDTEGVTHEIQRDVRQGEAIRFVVHKRGAIAFDTTYWDPEIAYTDGTYFRASEGFATGISDTVPWRYEMERGPAEGAESTSQAFVFTKDLLLETVELDTATTALSIGQDSHLPLAVVACRGGSGGTLIALNAERGGWQIDIARPDSLGQVSVKWRSDGDGAPRREDYLGGWPNALEDSACLPAFEAPFIQQQHVLAIAAPPLSPALWAMVVDAWLHEDGYPKTPRDLAAAAEGHLDRSLLLAAGLEGAGDLTFAEKARHGAVRLRRQVAAAKDAPSMAGGLYVAVRRLKRELLLHRPEFAIDRLLVCKRVPTSYSHLVMQFYGWRARAGGGLFVLDRPGYTLNAQDILHGQLETGSVLQPSLHWDGERIVFSYVENAGRSFDPAKLEREKDDAYFHLWTVNTDGTGLRQLTQGPFEDLMPTWLPDGGIAFCSTRRRGYARCFGPSFSPRWDTYTLHRAEADGSDLTLLSCNDVNEWFPVVSNDGRILYSRWDYIDRDAVTHQNLWSTRPDGANPLAVWGNALPSPHCTFQMQPIPNSGKLVFVAAAHHSIAGGSLVVLDPRRGENAVDAMQRITPEIPFPEAETRDIPSWYAAPWPLAEDLFLTAYSPFPLVWEPGANRRDALGIYLLDAAGNRELLYRDPDIGATNPIPLRPRTQPPAVEPSRDPALGDQAVFFVADVYDGLEEVVERGAVKELRVIQIFPKMTPLANNPRIGLAGEENARAVLGTVPMAPDGSAHFLAPARKPLLFQLLDGQGRAVQTMRSLTYAQPGERVSCVGCHEGGTKAAVSLHTEAGRRAPVAIVPGPFDGKPFSFVQVVQPVLDKHCVPCHGGEEPPEGLDLTGTPDRGFTRSYWGLCGDPESKKEADRKRVEKPLVPRFAQRNQIQITPPGGGHGARGSLLLDMLDKGHNEVELSEGEMRRLALWIDCNAIFYGANLPERQALQLAGKSIPMPEIQ